MNNIIPLHGLSGRRRLWYYLSGGAVAMQLRGRTQENALIGRASFMYDTYCMITGINNDHGTGEGFMSAQRHEPREDRLIQA